MKIMSPALEEDLNIRKEYVQSNASGGNNWTWELIGTGWKYLRVIPITINNARFDISMRLLLNPESSSACHWQLYPMVGTPLRPIVLSSDTIPRQDLQTLATVNNLNLGGNALARVAAAMIANLMQVGLACAGRVQISVPSKCDSEGSWDVRIYPDGLLFVE